MSEWHHVKDGHIPFNQSLLVFIPNAEHYGPGIYRAILVNMGSGIRWHFTSPHRGHSPSNSDEITHWMPLPEPPSIPPEATYPPMTIQDKFEDSL